MDIQKMMQTGEGIEQLTENLLDLDSEFRFKCRRCGKCCIHQDTIILNTRDIYNIARKQGRPMQGAIEDYTEVYIGRNSRLPIVHLLSNGPKDTCPLLVDGRCSVHDCKPTVCALYPLGRVIISQKGSEPFAGDSEPEVRYILNDYSCGSAARVNTVRSWLQQFSISEHDEFFLLWNRVIMRLSLAIRDLESKKFPQRVIQMLWDMIFNVLYLQYDTQEEIMPQFQTAADKLLKLADALKDPEFARFVACELEAERQAAESERA